MGQQCCAESKQDSGLGDGGEKDLPAVTRNVKDQYLKFELALPFQRILINVFLKKVDNALKECGDSGFVTIEALRKQFTTQAWHELKTDGSPLIQILTAPAFKREGHTMDQIDVDILKTIGLFHCAGKPRDKAIVFYGILQEGGVEKHTFISAQDKDLIPVFEKMCSLATWELFEIAKQVGEVKEDIYNEEEIESLKE